MVWRVFNIKVIQPYSEKDKYITIKCTYPKGLCQETRAKLTLDYLKYWACGNLKVLGSFSNTAVENSPVG